MAEVISGLKLVWDVLVGLVRGYETGKKDFFATHAEPLHQRMLTIHKDYIAGFEEAKRYLENNENPPSVVIDFLEQRRRDHLAERELTEKLAEELASAERRLVRDDVWTSLREYCSAVVNYFSAASEVGGISWYTDFLNSVRAKTRAGYSDVWSTALATRLSHFEREPYVWIPLNQLASPCSTVSLWRFVPPAPVRRPVAEPSSRLWCSPKVRSARPRKSRARLVSRTASSWRGCCRATACRRSIG